MGSDDLMTDIEAYAVPPVILISGNITLECVFRISSDMPVPVSETQMVCQPGSPVREMVMVPFWV